MTNDATREALLARASLLRDHGRYAEAESLLADALRVDPENPGVFCEIALCRLQAGDREAEALEAIDRAVALDAENAFFRAVRSLILHDLRRGPDALAAAEEAVALDPELVTAHVAHAHALAILERHAESEAAIRRALAIDPDHRPAHNMLSRLLRMQNRRAENADQISFMLEQNPEDADTHANAGWASLQTGDRATAQRHFLEALRLEPANEMARTGLLEAYKSRSRIYRTYLDYCLYMQRFTHRQQWAIVIGAYFIFTFARRLARSIGPGWAGAVVAIYLLIVFWSHLARSVGNALVLIDRVARQALRPQERLDGMVGGLVLLGVAGGVAGLLLHSATMEIVAIGLLALCVPLGKALLNASRKGQLVFGGLALLVVTALLVFGASFAIPNLRSAVHPLGFLAICGVALSTFLGNVRALRG